MKLSRVHPLEWLVGLIGLVMVEGLIWPWNGGESAFASPDFLHVLVFLVAVAGIVLPVSVAMSARTNVPVVYETMLWIFTLLVALILILRNLVQADVVFESGYLALGGTLVMSFALWRSVARER
jgi:hypothetical protein